MKTEDRGDLSPQTPQLRQNPWRLTLPPRVLALLFVASHKNGSPAPAPDLAPPSPELPPLRGWAPERLPDGSWGARHSVPGKLPADLEGATIEIKTRKGDILIRTVVEVVERTADYVLVRDSGKPSPA